MERKKEENLSRMERIRSEGWKEFRVFPRLGLSCCSIPALFFNWPKINKIPNHLAARPGTCLYQPYLDVVSVTRDSCSAERMVWNWLPTGAAKTFLAMLSFDGKLSCQETGQTGSGSGRQVWRPKATRAVIGCLVGGTGRLIAVARQDEFG